MVTMDSVNVSLANQRPTTPTSLSMLVTANQPYRLALISSAFYISDTIMMYNIAFSLALVRSFIAK
jgi:hypothetical protein